MRSRAVTVLAVLGVLGAGSAAMAVNADTFASGAEPMGNSSGVLVPDAEDSPTPGPTADPSDGAEDKVDDRSESESGDARSRQAQTPAPLVRQPTVTPPRKAAASPSRPPATTRTPKTHHESDDHESEDHESEDRAEDEHEEDDD